MHPKKQDIQDYWKIWMETRDLAIGEMLVKTYMPLVNYHIQKIAAGLPNTVSKDDLKSFGLIGLYDAMEKYDMTKESKFDTYASIRIRGAILDGLRKEDWLPRTSREKTKKLEAFIERLEQEHLRKLHPSEIAQLAGLKEEEVYQIMSEGYFANVISLDDFSKNQEDSKEYLVQVVKDSRIRTPEEQTIQNELIKELTESIEEYLTDNEKHVLSLFYKENLTLTEIGHVLDLSTSRISQIHAKAISKLRNALKKIM